MKPDIIFLREIQYLSVRNIFVLDRYISPKLRVGMDFNFSQTLQDQDPLHFYIEGEEAGRGRVDTLVTFPDLPYTHFSLDYR